ncbi:hypothetical protein T440DRAFT_80706 [Plenodomus tracheiphilus IPT5]|uniref:Yeast cell wall synthesis Kre9/Knh1-like N-terminal domain-containing protein n=1 Tax=Plenodomus tracheiphilus IPT5 TaxID=1408161 RepID=A0A6A7B552_9PLEO|nr:hypothetical protein T440DRAFT_80706 [Plenodomus tracheiphilus IPT5]
MRFESIFAGAALIAAAIAQNLAINSFPSSGVVAGQTYEVTYSPADNTPTTFILRQGPSGNLNTVGTLTTSAIGGKFSWTVSGALANQADYALEIRRGDQVNYSAQFGLTGGSNAVSSAVASAASAASSAASSASAALSSALSSIQASATVSPSAGLNSTISTATLSRSATGTRRPSATTTASIPESTGAAASMAGSPLAAVFGAVAAFAYLA